MQTFDAVNDQQQILSHLHDQGYVVTRGLIDSAELQRISDSYDELMTREREMPFIPVDGPPTATDAEMEAYLAGAYKVSDAELARTMRRIRHTRAENYGTPWPVAAEKVNHSFLHIPLLLNDDRTQRSYNLPAKLENAETLFAHPQVVEVMGQLLDPDFVLADFSGINIGPGTDAAYWHVDAPFTMVPEPLPDIPLAIQVAWMLDDFTAANGATRVVPNTHRTRKKPPWGYDAIEGEIPLTGQAGSLAVWLSQTWHRAGANTTEEPRRALLSNYTRAWIKPFNDHTRSVPPALVERYSPRARYLLGFSAYGPTRG